MKSVGLTPIFFNSKSARGWTLQSDFETPRFNIFVSSTVYDLTSERKAIKRSLESIARHFRAWLSEDCGSDSSSPEKDCMAMARSCDFFILILGGRYGFIPEGKSISVTEMEFTEASNVNRTKIRAYLKKVTEMEPQQERFVKQVRDFSSGIVCPTFKTTNELKKLIVNDTVTYHGSPRRHRFLPSPSDSIAHSAGVLTPGAEKVFLPEHSSSIELRTENPDFTVQQRVYLKENIHVASPGELAEKLIQGLTKDDLCLLGFIAVGDFLARHDYLQSLIPDTDWMALAKRLEGQGILRIGGSELHIATNIHESLRHDSELITKSHKKWVSVLEPKAEYTDLALFLCLHRIALKRTSDAIAHAHSMMLSIEDQHTAKLFHLLLDQIRRSKHYRRLSFHDRILLLDAIGVFLVNDGRYGEALNIFKSMLYYSQKSNDSWALSQAHLHRGLTWAYSGENRRAERDYRKAIDFARRNGDQFQLGRILHNLSQLQIDDDPVIAAQTLEESIQHKKRSGDRAGLYGSYIARGILAGLADDEKTALHWFRKAKQQASRLQSYYALANALHNESVSLSKLGKTGKAISLSQQAREIAESLARKDLIVLTTQGEAVHRAQAQDYAGALPLFIKLHELKRESGDTYGTIVALADAGVMELNLKDYVSAETRMRQAIEWAKSERDYPWLVPSILNLASLWNIQGKSDVAKQLLQQEIEWAEEKCGWGIVSLLAESLVQMLISQGSPSETIDELWKKAISTAAMDEDIIRQVELHRQRYVWTREKQGPQNAEAALHQFLKLTTQYKTLKRERIEILYEMATCLHAQGKHAKAEEYYTSAIKLSEKTPDFIVQEALFNDYAELLRRTGRSTEAIPFYERAVAISQSKEDLDGRLLTEHNLALALEDLGHIAEAKQLFRKVRDSARRQGLWTHHVNAWFALANMDWVEDHRQAALVKHVKIRSLCENFGLTEIGLEAALSEARLLLELKRNGDALSLLKPLSDDFKDSEYCPELFLALSDSFVATGEHKQAVEALERGLKCPKSKYYPERQIPLRKALVIANYKAGSSNKVRLEIEHSLSTELPPEDRKEQLCKLLVIVAAEEANKRGRAPQTERIIKEIRIHSEAHSRCGWIRDAYIYLGDTLWEVDSKSAMEAYLAGVFESLKCEEPESHLQITGQVASKLHRLGLTIGEKQIAHLQNQTSKWLKKQFEANTIEPRQSDRVSPWLMWPFEFALSLLKRADKGRRIKADEIQKLITDFVLSPKMKDR